MTNIDPSQTQVIIQKRHILIRQQAKLLLDLAKKIKTTQKPRDMHDILYVEILVVFIVPYALFAPFLKSHDKAN